MNHVLYLLIICAAKVINVVNGWTGCVAVVEFHVVFIVLVLVVVVVFVVVAIKIYLFIHSFIIYLFIYLFIYLSVYLFIVHHKGRKNLFFVKPEFNGSMSEVFFSLADEDGQV